MSPPLADLLCAAAALLLCAAAAEAALPDRCVSLLADSVQCKRRYAGDLRRGHAAAARCVALCAGAPPPTNETDEGAEGCMRRAVRQCVGLPMALAKADEMLDAEGLCVSARTCLAEIGYGEQANSMIDYCHSEFQSECQRALSLASCQCVLLAAPQCHIDMPPMECH